MALSLHQLKILGIISAGRKAEGWFWEGSSKISDILKYPQDEIQVELKSLLHDKYLEKGLPKSGEKHFPLRLTSKAQ